MAYHGASYEQLEAKEQKIRKLLVDSALSEREISDLNKKLAEVEATLASYDKHVTDSHVSTSPLEASGAIDQRPLSANNSS